MSIIDQNTGEALTVWVGTQSEYDGISFKDENTLYFIKESGGYNYPDDSDGSGVVTDPGNDSDGTTTGTDSDGTNIGDDSDGTTTGTDSDGTNIGNDSDGTGVVTDPVPSPTINENIMVVGTAVHFESDVNQPLEDNALYDGAHAAAVTLDTSPVIQKLLNGDSVHTMFEGKNFETVESSDSHILASTAESVLQNDGSRSLGMLYVYSLVDIQRVRNLELHRKNNTELRQIAEAEGFLTSNNSGVLDPFWGNMNLSSKARVLQHYLLDPKMITGTSYSTDPFVAEPEPDLPNDQPHWSGSQPRYEWSEYVDSSSDEEEISLILIWNNNIVYQEIIPSTQSVATTITTDSGTYIRGDLRGSYGENEQSQYYSIIREG